MDIHFFTVCLLYTKQGHLAIISEAIVRKQGMTLEQLSCVLNNFQCVSASSHDTDSATLDIFRAMVVEAMKSPNQHVKIHFDSTVVKTHCF